MLNHCEFIGNLGADPDVRTIPSSGKAVVNLRLAVTEKWKDQTGERKERTEWVSVTIFSEGLAKVAEQYLRKGSKIYISGKWTTRKWTDQEGKDRYSTELVLSGREGKLIMLDSQGTSNQQNPPYGGSEPQNGAGGFRDDLDDDLPFAMEWR